MSRPYRCDRCGKLGDPAEDGKLPDGWTDTIPPNWEDCDSYADLCPECSRSFIEWWDRPRKVHITVKPEGTVSVEGTDKPESVPAPTIPEIPLDGPTESHLKRFGLNLAPELQPHRREMCRRLYDLLKDAGDLETICERSEERRVGKECRSRW